MLQLPVQKCAIIINTSSIWIVFLTVIVYQQLPNLKTVILIIFAFLGIILIIDPSMLNLGSIGQDDASLFWEKWPYYLLLLASGMM